MSKISGVPEVSRRTNEAQDMMEMTDQNLDEAKETNEVLDVARKMNEDLVVVTTTGQVLVVVGDTDGPLNVAKKRDEVGHQAVNIRELLTWIVMVWRMRRVIMF